MLVAFSALFRRVLDWGFVLAWVFERFAELVLAESGPGVIRARVLEELAWCAGSLCPLAQADKVLGVAGAGTGTERTAKTECTDEPESEAVRPFVAESSLAGVALPAVDDGRSLLDNSGPRNILPRSGTEPEPDLN